MDLRKLLNVIRKLKVDKSRDNNYGNYKYRNAEDILAKLKPLAFEYGLFIKTSDSIEMIGDRYYVKSTVSVYDAETGDKIAENFAYAREATAHKGMDDSQVTGSSSSYARKYALAGLFNLSPSDDSDDNCNLEQLKNMLNKCGVDVDHFATVMFGYNSSSELTQEELNASANHVKRLTDIYKALGARKYSLNTVSYLLSLAGVDANDFCKVMFNSTAENTPSDKIDRAMDNFENAVKAYKNAVANGIRR